MEDVKLLFLRKGYERSCKTNAEEGHSLEAFTTDDSVVNINTPNVLREPGNSVLRSLGHGERGDPPSQTECFEYDVDAENNSF